MNHVIHTQTLVNDEVRHAFRPLAVIVAQCTLPDVQVKQHHLLPGRKQAVGKMGGNERLSSPLVDGCGRNDLQRLVLAAHECQVGSHYLEGLPDVAVVLLLLRNSAEERQCQLALKILAAVHPGVQEHYHKEYDARYGKAEQKAEE